MASGQNISPSPGTPDHGGGGVMGMGGGASGASSATNPRKFSEKIALHKQREAEEKKEFEKMMNELKAVKGPSPQRTVNSGNMLNQTSSPINMGANAGPGGGYNMSHHQTTANAHQRHLSPHMPSGVIRHGSLPNVNAAMGLQMPPHIQHVISSEEFPLILNSQNGGVNATLGLSGSHVSVRDTVQGTSTGPIRNRSRMNTSPYGSDRHSPGGYHLSPPDPSWRRVVSDSAIHKSANEVGRSPDGSDGGGGLLSLVNGGQNSPLRGASPTVLRRVQANSQHRLQQQQQQQQQHHHHQMSNSSPSHNQVPSTSMNESDVQSMDHTSNFLLPQDKDGPDKNNPGSLPDLTNFHVNASPLSGHQAMENEDQGSYSSSPATGNSPGTMAGTQWSPGTVPSSPHSPILTVSTAPPDPHINTSPLPTTPIPISQFQNHEQVFFPNSLPNVSMMGMNPVVTGNQYFADKQGCLQSTASLPVTPWLHKRYPHLAHSPSPIIHESADNLFFGRDDFSVQQPLRSMGSVPATVVNNVT
ncbi:CREB-regulated transcription coactivator 1-like [Tigriopus californicus]|uniref:CREB-regulated transcription coactivator 1-like n=1 Tax=Tigriopus californicus TaxID=6832 RepID=UPI0027DA990B|nr:CREB-regulated transcription coactivator 1-like [Tigriopus californicus]